MKRTPSEQTLDELAQQALANLTEPDFALPDERSSTVKFPFIRLFAAVLDLAIVEGDTAWVKRDGGGLFSFPSVSAVLGRADPAFVLECLREIRNRKRTGRCAHINRVIRRRMATA